MARLLYLDLETRSRLDVTKVGAFAYAEHPSTEILCIAWALDDEPVQVSPTIPGFMLASGPEYAFVAHNADFERNMLRKAGLYVPLESWIDTAALAARMSLPRSLEELAAFLWPDDPTKGKDMAGNRVMQKLAKPRRPSKDNPDEWWTPETKPDDFKTLYAYCAKDVEVMRAAHKRLLALTPMEDQIRLLTDRMNWRGIRINVDSIAPAQALLADVTTELAKEFQAIVGCPAKSPVKAAAALGLPSMEKDVVRKALREPGLPASKHRALTLHRMLSRSSTAKLDAMKRRVSADGRLRGLWVYSGAERTARWSSFGVQAQNFPRGLGEQTETAFAALHAGVLTELFEGMPRDAPAPPLDPVGTVAEMLRGYFTGPFLVGDFAQIEARTLAWLAGQDDLVQTFRDHGDPYCKMAGRIYSREITKKDKAERFMGKQVVLGAGYGIGWRGLQNALDKTYDVAIDDDFAQKVIKAYRGASGKITALWDKFDRGMKFVILNKSKKVKVGPVFMGTLEVGGVPYAYIELPSTRRLYYARPHVKGNRIRYFGRDIRRGGAWGTVETYGGKITENVTQATSRDMLAEAMLRLEAAGFVLLGTVHDEIIAEDGNLERFKAIMEEVPAWASGVPLEAECFRSNRYRK